MPFKDPEKQREYARRYRKANQERRRENDIRWRKANQEKVAENDKRKRAANPEKYKEMRRQWYSANKEKTNASSRRWNKTHPEKKRALTQARRANKINASPPGRYVTALAVQARHALFGYRCAWCINGPAEHDDHVLPLSLGGLHVPENIVPACARCNTRKGASLPERWYLSQPFFDQERWSLICRHSNLQSSGVEQLTLGLDI